MCRAGSIYNSIIIISELRHLAAYRLAQEKPGQTLQATALVHEAYLRLVTTGDDRWDNRRHFFGAAAEAMGRILIDRARRKQQLKHGGAWKRVAVDAVELAAPMPEAELLALDEGLKELEKLDPDGAKLVKLRFFAGLTEKDAAQALDISVATAQRSWAFCRVWLFKRVSGDRSSQG